MGQGVSSAERVLVGDCRAAFQGTTATQRGRAECQGDVCGSVADPRDLSRAVAPGLVRARERLEISDCREDPVGIARPSLGVEDLRDVPRDSSRSRDNCLVTTAYLRRFKCASSAE